MPLPDEPSAAGTSIRLFGRAWHPFDLLSAALLVTLAVLAVLTFRDYGVGWDDPAQMTYGDLVVKFLASGFADQGAIHFRNLRFYGGLFEAPVEWLGHFLPMSILVTRHLFCAAAGIAAIAIAWRFARYLGGPLAGFLAALFLAFLPSFYGHMFINSKDIPFAMGYALGLFALVRVAEDFPRLRVSTALFLGIGFGLATGIRVAGVMVVLYLAVVLVFDTVWSKGWRTTSVAQGLRGLVPIVVVSAPVAYVLMIAFWPWALLNPIMGPVKSILESAHFDWNGLVLFNGTYFHVNVIPPSYLPVYFGVKLPEISLVALLVSIPMAAWGFVVALRQGSRRIVYGVLVLGFGAFFPIVYAIVAHPVFYDAIRQFLFLLPPMAVLAGWQITILINRFVGRRRSVAVPVAIVGVLGFGVTGWQMHTLHPYEYIYYNALTGGLPGASGRFETDYWGTSYREAVYEMVYHVDQEASASLLAKYGRPHGVYVCGPGTSASPFFPSDYRLVTDLHQADFFISYTRFGCDHRIAAPVLATVKRDGVPLAYVKDLRAGYRLLPEHFKRIR